MSAEYTTGSKQERDRTLALVGEGLETLPPLYAEAAVRLTMLSQMAYKWGIGMAGARKEWRW